MSSPEEESSAPPSAQDATPARNAPTEHVEQLSFEQMAAWAGPLPPPEAFRQYDMVLPGSSERILRMAERDLEHRHEEERRLNTAAIDTAKTGQAFAVMFTMMALTASIVFFAIGIPTAGVAFLSPPVVMLVRSAVVRGRSQRDEKSSDG